MYMLDPKGISLENLRKTMVSCSAHVLGYPREQVLRQGTVREKTVIGKPYKTIGKTTFWVVGKKIKPLLACQNHANQRGRDGVGKRNKDWNLVSTVPESLSLGMIYGLESATTPERGDQSDRPQKEP